jgi:hypothetical protein
MSGVGLPCILLLPVARDEHVGVIAGERDVTFRHDGTRGGFVDDGFAGSEGGQRGLEGEVIDDAG